MTNPNDQVFPRNYAYMNPEAGKSELKSLPGLTKREYFAAMAMQGYCADPTDVSFIQCARDAITQADALIAELNKEAQP